MTNLSTKNNKASGVTVMNRHALLIIYNGL